MNNALYNALIEAKGQEFLNKLRANIISKGFNHKKRIGVSANRLIFSERLHNKIRLKHKDRDGLINKVVITGPRHGFIHTNVGKGYKVRMSNGTRIALEGGGPPRDWLWDELDKHHDLYADLMQFLHAELAAAGFDELPR